MDASDPSTSTRKRPDVQLFLSSSCTRLFLEHGKEPTMATKKGREQGLFHFWSLACSRTNMAYTAIAELHKHC